MKKTISLILFLLYLGLNATAYGQPSILDSCICYTDRQDENCLRCLLNEELNEELIDTLLSQVEDLKLNAEDLRLNAQDLRLNIEATQEIVRIREEEIEFLRKENKRQRRRKVLGILGTAVVGVLTTVIL